MDASLVAVILAPILGLVGVLIGGLSLRSRDVREMRRRAYVEWQLAAEFFPFFDPSQGPIPGLPTTAMLRKIKEVTTEMAVVGSREVIDAANGFTAIVTGSGYVQTMNAAKLQTVEDTLRLHDKLTGASRRKTLQAMRRDLLPWWHLSSRDLPSKPQVVA